MTEVDLLDDGLIWLINRCLFHRVGYALGIAEDGSAILLGDGTEEWRFDPDDDLIETRARAVRHLLGESQVDRLMMMVGPEPREKS